MPFGFKKPSRSYAAEANVYYDPFSGYPTPYDPHTRPSANSGGTNGVGYGGTRNTGRSGGETDSTSTASSRAVRNKKKPVHHVHYAEEPTNTPSKLMRPRSSASVGRAKTRLGVNKGKGNQTRQQDVGAAMATFSALDLAPLPPKSKRNVMAEELQRSDEEQRSAEEVDDVGDRYSGSTSNGARYALGGGNDPPHAGFSSGDVSETEAEAESELSEGEDEEAKGEINARDREHDDSDHRVETIRASLAGAPTGEQPHPTQPLDQIHNEAHYHADFVRPSLRIEQYNSHGQLTPPMSDPGATAAARLTGHSTPQGTVSQAEATSYDAASPWSVYATAPSAAPASFSLTVGQSSRPGSRSSMRSSHRGKNQVSRKYALSPPLSPLGGQGSLVAAAISGNRLYGNADEGESSIRTERHRHEVETEEDGETETQGPSTPVPNAMLAPPTFALQPPTPQHDITHTPFHDVGGRRLSRDAEGDSNLDQRAPTSGYQLPNGLTLDALTHTSAPPAMGPFDGVLERPGPVSSSSRTSSHSTKSSLTSAQAVSTRQGGAPSLHNPTSASLAHNSRSASPTPPQSAVESTTSSGGPPPPAPLNPNQPAFLKWDTSNQRWIPVPTLASNTMPPPQQLQPKRPESVMSSVSAYSQISAPKSVAPPPMSSSSAAGFGMTPANQARRQSLPTLALSPSKSIRGAPSPVMSSRSRPASPSMAPILAPPITGPGSVNGFSAGRRMSIDPPYLMNPNILTLLPEMYEADLGPAETPLSSRSAPHSRTPSIDGRASAAGGRYNGYRASFSSYRPRNSTAFPMGYDVNARAVEMSKANSGSRASSVYGDYASDGEHRWQETYGTSRATSVHEDDVPYEESEYEAESRMGGGAFVGAPPRSVDDGQRKDSVKPGRESALDVMSVRGDSVQMHGLDGTDQPPSGYS
ncbi:hypothetical protein QFC19_007797 [Naganishia cerealis]|uniref:Uncharacterized protein n=1 Tax=Naganishia cerealis TaxID=610337 RepID=A0ACC2V687_9TREE|nr:hypothetical protein QFC19_007797 [Naganishia cerealis]